MLITMSNGADAPFLHKELPFQILICHTTPLLHPQQLLNQTPSLQFYQDSPSVQFLDAALGLIQIA